MDNEFCFERADLAILIHILVINELDLRYPMHFQNTAVNFNYGRMVTLLSLFKLKCYTVV